MKRSGGRGEGGAGAARPTREGMCLHPQANLLDAIPEALNGLADVHRRETWRVPATAPVFNPICSQRQVHGGPPGCVPHLRTLVEIEHVLLGVINRPHLALLHKLAEPAVGDEGKDGVLHRRSELDVPGRNFVVFFGAPVAAFSQAACWCLQQRAYSLEFIA